VTRAEALPEQFIAKKKKKSEVGSRRRDDTGSKIAHETNDALPSLVMPVRLRARGTLKELLFKKGLNLKSDRMADEEIAFVAKTNDVDDRVHDGHNYAGLMDPKDYVAKREQVKLGEDAYKAQLLNAARERDARAALAESREREARQKRKKEQLRGELESAPAAADGAGPGPSAAGGKAARSEKKQKRGKGAAPTSKLSFDDDE
jgi:hypothetical protein